MLLVQGFLKSHEALLGKLPCQVKSPLSLGEGAGHLRARGVQEIELPAGSSLKDLVAKGVSVSQAAVSAIVRLREELELVESVPVLYAIDEVRRACPILTSYSCPTQEVLDNPSTWQQECSVSCAALVVANSCLCVLGFATVCALTDTFQFALLSASSTTAGSP